MNIVICLLQLENKGSRRSYQMVRVTEHVTGRMGIQAHFSLDTVLCNPKTCHWGNPGNTLPYPWRRHLQTFHLFDLGSLTITLKLAWVSSPEPTLSWTFLRESPWYVRNSGLGTKVNKTQFHSLTAWFEWRTLQHLTSVASPTMMIMILDLKGQGLNWSSVRCLALGLA